MLLGFLAGRSNSLGQAVKRDLGLKTCEVLSLTWAYFASFKYVIARPIKIRTVHISYRLEILKVRTTLGTLWVIVAKKQQQYLSLLRNKASQKPSFQFYKLAWKLLSLKLWITNKSKWHWFSKYFQSIAITVVAAIATKTAAKFKKVTWKSRWFGLSSDSYMVTWIL